MTDETLMTHVVEMVGGPVDGERVKVFKFVDMLEYRIHPNRVVRYFVTVHQTKDGHPIFEWEGMK